MDKRAASTHGDYIDHPPPLARQVADQTHLRLNRSLQRMIMMIASPTMTNATFSRSLSVWTTTVIRETSRTCAEEHGNCW